MNRREKRTSWPEIVVSIAMERAKEESLKLWRRSSGEEPPFNYRLEHLKAVVRIAEGLALSLGADVPAWVESEIERYRRQGWINVP